MNDSKKTLLLGGGYVLSRLAAELEPESFIITTRSADKLETFKKLGYQAAILDVENNSEVRDFFKSNSGITSIIDSVPPGGPVRAKKSVKLIVECAKNSGVSKLLYLSTTGVFGVTDGSVVDETTHCKPQTPKAKARLLVEEEYSVSGLDFTTFRIPAIYGPGRGPGISLKGGVYPLIAGGESWSNRVHVDDIVSCLKIALETAGLPKVLCLSDDLPALTKDVVAFYCEKFDIEYPASISEEEAGQKKLHTLLSSQKVSNALLKSELSVELKYPSYKEGAGTEFE